MEEEYKKKYEKVINRAMSTYGTGAYDDATMEFLVPELKESDDERIRKEIIDFLNYYHTGQGNSRVFDKEWISWLEKHKEQKPVEWSEEDERIMESLISLIERISEYFFSDETRNGYVDWLKSLRPQPKQDVLPSLSEKEIICLKRALDYLRKEHNRYGGEDFTNEIAVLEWLITHPILAQQPHWKPSEEQMEALNKIIGYTFGDKMFYPQDLPVIYSLFNDLKKLKNGTGR